MKERGLIVGAPESERTSLTYKVAALLRSGASDHDLIEAAIARYLDNREQGT